jgi:hypothetical protein
VVLQPEAAGTRKQATRGVLGQGPFRRRIAGHQGDQTGDIQADDQPSSATVTRTPAILVIQRDAQHPAGSVTLRLIIRRSPDGHQTPILTNRTD